MVRCEKSSRHAPTSATIRMVHLVTEGESSLPAHQPHAYDGWIAFYSYWGSIAAGSTLTTDWVIPASPTVDPSGLDIAFFNDIETATGGNDDILQPVLDYNSGVWTLEAEHCCINGNDAYNAPGTALSVGDTILGTVKGSNCSSDGSCSTWLVTTQDTTKNITATLTVANAAGAPMGVHPAVLETYGVTACNNLPASGKETFANNSLTDGNGKAQAVSYDFGSTPPSGYPACGYSGNVSGNDYTLIFSKSVGGTTSTGGAAGTGGNVATGGNRATGGNPATGGRSSTGGTAATGGSRATGGEAATGGSTTASSGTGTGGRANTGGTPATGGSATGTGGSATGGSKFTGGATSVVSPTGGATVQAAASGGAAANTGGRANSGGTAATNTSNNTGGTVASMGGSGTNTTTAPLSGSSAVGASSPSSSAPSNTSTDTGSCSCRVPGKRATPADLTSRAAILGLASLCVIRRRRRRPRNAKSLGSHSAHEVT